MTPPVTANCIQRSDSPAYQHLANFVKPRCTLVSSSPLGSDVKAALTNSSWRRDTSSCVPCDLFRGHIPPLPLTGHNVATPLDRDSRQSSIREAENRFAHSHVPCSCRGGQCVGLRPLRCLLARFMHQLPALPCHAMQCHARHTCRLQMLALLLAPDVRLCCLGVSVYTSKTASDLESLGINAPTARTPSNPPSPSPRHRGCPSCNDAPSSKHPVAPASSRCRSSTAQESFGLGMQTAPYRYPCRKHLQDSTRAQNHDATAAPCL